MVPEAKAGAVQHQNEKKNSFYFNYPGGEGSPQTLIMEFYTVHCHIHNSRSLNTVLDQFPFIEFH